MFQSILKELLESRSNDSLFHHFEWDRIKNKSHIKTQLIGYSEEKKELWAFKTGNGAKKISLIAGCHSDEPVGPEMLKRLIYVLSNLNQDIKKLLSQYTFYICPHLNPDGESKNLNWITEWPSFQAYIDNSYRELPGRDIEFGFPDMRIENSTWTKWVKNEGPFHCHISFHGMGYSEGPMLLIEKHWIKKTSLLQEAFKQKTRTSGYLLHDHDRKGDKGFIYIAPGFTTTPEGSAMKKHFLDQKDNNMASKFKLSSMEWIRTLGGDPLCLVTELPLFCIQKKEGRTPGFPTHHITLKQAITTPNFDCSQVVKELEIQPFPIKVALEFQLFILEKALETI